MGVRVPAGGGQAASQGEALSPHQDPTQVEVARTVELSTRLHEISQCPAAICGYSLCRQASQFHEYALMYLA